MNWWKKRSTFQRLMVITVLTVVSLAAFGNALDGQPDTATGPAVVQIDEPATVYEPAERVTTATDAAYTGLPVHNAFIGIMVEQFGTFNPNELALLCSGSEIFFESYWNGFRNELEAQGSEPIVTKDELRNAFDMALIRVCS